MTSLDVLDAVEQQLQKPVTELDPRGLIDYVCFKHREVYGYKYPLDFIKDRSLLTRAQKHYGDDLGKMIKFVFNEHGGRWRDESFSLHWWAYNCRWISDRIYSALKEYEREPEANTAGFASLSAIV